MGAAQKELYYIPFESIEVPEERYRKSFTGINELRDSIRKYGLIAPLVISFLGTKTLLTAGERRYRAIKDIHENFPEEYNALFPQGIPMRPLSDLADAEIRAIELEENCKRKDLTWKERALAYLNYHEMRVANNPKHTSAETGEALVADESTTRRYISVGRCLRDGDEQVEASGSFETAVKLLERRRKRALDDDIEFMEDTLPEVVAGEVGEVTTEDFDPKINVPKEDKAATTRSALKDISACNFFEMVKTYSGPKFNFIHCDFPYGVNLDKSGQARSRTKDSFHDAPELYWKFVDEFISARNRLLMKSAHIMFWYSMKYHEETVQRFLAAGFSVNPWPLVWHKSDNKGILPDPERGPRNTYETALFITRGGRRVVRAVANSYAAPTQRGDSLHISQKPIPVLRHFFKMIVDDTTLLLDPTCGSGGALCAAELARAKVVKGWDINAEFVKTAVTELNKTRQLRYASKELTE